MFDTRAKWCPLAQAWALNGQVCPDKDGDSGPCMYWNGKHCRELISDCRENNKPELTEERND